MEKRTEKLAKLLDELNVDGIFLTDLYNLRYFAGFTGTTGVALATRKGNFFYSDFRYRSQAEAQVSKMGFEFKEVSRGSLKFVGEHAEKLGLKKIGFEDHTAHCLSCFGASAIRVRVSCAAFTGTPMK